MSGVLSAVVLAEFCHRRMMQEAQGQGLLGSNPAKALGQDPALVRSLSQYARDVQDLLAGEFAVLDFEVTDLPKAIELQRQHGLLTNDSLLLAAAMRVGVSLLATADPQFSVVPGLQVFTPDDVQNLAR